MEPTKNTSDKASTSTEKELTSEEKASRNQDTSKAQIKLTSTNSTRNKETTVRGKPKSGRIWKTCKERFATLKKTIRGKKTKERMAYREEMKQIRELSQSIREDKRRENEEKRLRREENHRRRLENERRSQIVQVIKNPAKLKRMRKKQLRMIEKRDLSTLKIV